MHALIIYYLCLYMILPVWGAQNHAWHHGIACAKNEMPHPIWIKISRMVDVLDVTTCTNFDDDRLRHFLMVVTNHLS